MYINKKRIINVDAVLSEFNKNEKLRIILDNPMEHKIKLQNIGFSSIEIGNSLLPKIIGNISRYNADGKFELLRDEPKESYSVMRDLTFLAYGKHEKTTTISFTYNRFKRKLISAPSEELIVISDKDNKLIISSELIEFNKTNRQRIKHVINLFLELFGECQLVDEALISRLKTPIKRLNWNLLPKGQISKEKLEEYLEENTDIAKVKNTKDIFGRINYINSFKPTFLATGNGGFNDYIVLGFEDKNIYILENRKPQNATYIFLSNWKEITKLTKLDILKEQLQEHRVLHTKSWKKNIKEILLEI